MNELPLIFLGGIVKKISEDRAKEKKINELVLPWQKVCVKWESFFSNKTQRAAIWKIYQELGKRTIVKDKKQVVVFDEQWALMKYKKAVGFLPKLLNAKYCPKIDCPLDLYNKLERYRSFINNHEDWARAFAKFIPEEVNVAGRKKYQSMLLDFKKSVSDNLKQVSQGEE